jgi:ribonucleoside-diphosphate reductase alpha chain
LADVFQMLCLPYDSDGAKELNKDIFETIYHAAVSESIRRAASIAPYATYEGSPASEGKLQFDLWDVKPSKCDWGPVKEMLATFGLRNSLLVAPMPTASTAQILGNTESFEPRTSNLYVRRTLSGEFMVINKHLQRVLQVHGLWDDDMANKLIAARGSVQGLDIPDDVKAVFKTVWEISQKALIQQSAGRGPYVCQSQSLNLYLQTPNHSNLTAMHFYAWQQGLKTGSYYIRQKPAAQAMQFTVETKEDACLSCSA